MVLIAAFITLILLGLALALIVYTLGQEKDRIVSALAGKGAGRSIAPVLVLHRPANDDGPPLRGLAARAMQSGLGVAA